MRLKITSTALIFGLVVCSTSQAATITENDTSRCSVTLEGEIGAGDAQALYQIAERKGLLEPPDSGEPSNSPENALCLNSLGGSYLEGRIMAEIVHRYGITTRVEKDAVCFSACAFLFMAGRTRGYETDGTSRYLDAKGRLGFHAPYLQLDENEVFSGAELTSRMTTLNKILAEFIEFGSYSSIFDHRPMFSLALLGQMLSAGPDEMFEVRTIEDASRWGISLSGIPERRKIDENGLITACLNFQAWMVDKSSVDENYDPFPRIGEKDRRISGSNSKNWLRIDTGGMEEKFCLIENPGGHTSGLSICSKDDFNGLSYGDCSQVYGIWVPWYYSLHPTTNIRSIAAAH